MKTILRQCPQCGAPHALCWQHRVGGKLIGVLCDDRVVVRHKKGETSVAEHTKFTPIKFTEENPQPSNEELEGIPEYWTPAARRKQENAGNLQFVMMNTQEGEQVDRNIELPRAKPLAESFADDDKKRAKTLELELAQIQQAITEVSDAIEHQVKKRTGLENQEREIRRKLREFNTETLELK